MEQLSLFTRQVEPTAEEPGGGRCELCGKTWRMRWVPACPYCRAWTAAESKAWVKWYKAETAAGRKVST